MERIYEMYEMLDELEETLEDLLGDISEVIDMLEDGQTDEAIRYMKQLESSLQDFLREEEGEGESGCFEIEFDDDENEGPE
jgi:hypothetical protein